MDFDRRFGGIARLYGRDAFRVFSDAHVCIIGVGGVGSWTVESLARSAVGTLTLIDMDHVAESNINRQLPADTFTLGRSKISVMAQRVATINPEARVHLLDDFVSEENLQHLIGRKFDFVIDCIDSFRIKAALVAHCRFNKVPVITTGGAGGQLDPTRIRISDLSRTEQDPLLAKTRRQLRQRHGFSRNPKRRFGVPAVWSNEPLRLVPLAEVCETGGNSNLNCGGLGSCAPVTAGFGMAAAAHVLQKLAEHAIE